jgi:crotonobetainyl-CoA:carnitine CoA-transferase CaiB-like acyl-CoA transferase
MLRVLDFSHQPAGGFATMLMAQLGADVTRVADRDADSPMDADPDLARYLTHGKRVVQLETAASEHRAALLDLVRDNDVVVQDDPPGDSSRRLLTLRTLRRRNAGIVLTTITPFGLRGPRAHWKSSELVQQAMGGVLAASGHSDGPPTRLAGWQAAFAAGLQAAIATLAAVRHVRTCGARGVHIDVSIQEVFSTHWAREIGRYVYTGEGTARPSPALGLQGFPHTVRASDGYVFLLPLRAEWEAFAEFLGLDRFVTHEWSDAETRIARWDEIEPHFLAALAQRTRYEWFTAAAERGWTLGAVEDPRGLLTNPQLTARGYFVPARTPDDGDCRGPGLPFTTTVREA